MYEKRGNKIIEVRILPEHSYPGNIQGNIYQESALAKQKAKRNSVEFWEKELVKIKAIHKNYRGN